MMRKFLLALAALALVGGGFALSQPGTQNLTSLLGTYRVAIIAGATSASTSLSTLRQFTGSNLTCASYFATGNSDTDAVFFVATQAMVVSTVSEIHSTANGAALTLQLSKDSGTNAPGAGTDLLTAPFDLNATANTVQTGALVASATRTLAAGDRLAVDFSTTRTNLTGAVVTACMTPAS